MKLLKKLKTMIESVNTGDEQEYKVWEEEEVKLDANVIYPLERGDGRVGMGDGIQHQTINLTKEVMVGSYKSAVIAFANLANTNISASSWSSGTLILKRGNALHGNPLMRLSISVEKVYNSEEARYYIETGEVVGSVTKIRPCTFVKNNIKYAGIHLETLSAEHDNVKFEGFTNIKIFGIDYKSNNNGQILDAEVNSSLEFKNYQRVANTINGVPISMAGHTHAAADIASGVLNIDRIPQVPWSKVSDKPSTFAPSTHNHTWSQLSGGSTAAIPTSGSSGTWTSVNMSGSKNGYAGIYFTDYARYLMVNASIQGFHTGSDWQWYFSNGALTAGTVPWSLVSGKPSTFAPAAHNHDASDITSGLIPYARLAFQPASLINSGVFSAERIPPVNSMVIHDRRTSNPAPNWYYSNYPRQKVVEFKLLSAIGITAALGAFGTYCTLETFCPWNDYSGGGVSQMAHNLENRTIWTRRGSTTSWGPWLVVA